MNRLLWTLQVIAALVYGSSGIMKVFLFEKVSHDVPSFGALPRKAWTALGVMELFCVLGITVPDAFHWQPWLTVVAAAFLALEGFIFIWVHLKYREPAPIMFSAVLGLMMAFVAYGRLFLQPVR